MRFLLAAWAAAALAVLPIVSATVGFTTYTIITEGTDNSDIIAFNPPSRSDTLFLYIQITAGEDHSAIIDDFKTLCKNYGAHGVGVIPRVRYGFSNGTISTEPDADILLPDVKLWAKVFKEVRNTITIPVIQAGFLGQWGEWHSGQYCEVIGNNASATDKAIKSEIVTTLLGTGNKVAMRYPADHRALFKDDRRITLHDDCIFDGGPDGYDGGTFDTFDYTSRQFWVNYTLKVAGENTFGGEPCNNAGDATYNWSDTSALCGPDGLATYIKNMKISYLNPLTPDPLEYLFDNTTEPEAVECISGIQKALLEWK